MGKIHHHSDDEMLFLWVRLGFSPPSALIPVRRDGGRGGRRENVGEKGMAIETSAEVDASLFGRCSAVNVTGLLAIIDPCLIFHWFCLVFLHTWFPSHPLIVVYLTHCFPLSEVVFCYAHVLWIGVRRVLVPTFILLCTWVLEFVLRY
jgi:hypothetical protein